MSLDFGLQALDDNLTAQEEGLDVHVVKPGTQDRLLTIRVSGPDSKQQKRVVERSSEEALARGSVNPLTSSEQEDNLCKFVARCCISWSFADGRDIEFNEDNVAELFRRYPMIRKQVDQAAGDRNRFIKRS